MNSEVMLKPIKGKENNYKNKKKFIGGAKTGAIPEYLFYKAEHLYTYKNSLFGEAFHTCYIEHNASQIKAINSRFLYETGGKYYLITTNEARYNSWYKLLNVNTITGEIEAIIKESNSLMRQRGKVIKALKVFDEFYKPLYRKKKVSCLFGTLTNLPEASITMRMFMANLKKAFKRSGINLLSYVWVHEVKYKEAKGKQLEAHIHYHFVLAIERIEVTGGKLPECLSYSYLTGMWGQIAKVKFITGGTACLNYCSKYISKNGSSENGVVLGIRRYGASRNITKLSAK
ncbi:MAG: hypothetical protein EBR82_72210 [Caulobacteraceae bacterium]|nr:hypothetical protein [Caulobacteraceae bacterium]